MLKAKYINAALKTIGSIILNKITGYRVPLLAYILVTNRCNLNCIYCFSNANKTENIDIPLEKLYYIIDQLKEEGTILITIGGGEPCLREDIGDIINYISQKGMMVELVTNGINFQKNLETIKKLDFLAISVDGDEKTHDINRGKGSFEVAMRALKLAKEHGVHARIHACFSRKTSHALPELMDITKKYNVRANIAIPSIHTDDPLLAFTDDEIREYYHQMKEYKKKGYLVSNAYSTLEFISNWPGNFGYVAEKPDPSLPHLSCKRKEFCLYIDADGCAYPCASVWRKYKFNVFEIGVKKAFEEFHKISCITCIIEAEFHLLFKGNLSSLANVAAFGLWDKIKTLKNESM
ncbi:MAG: radical SAM protein [Thermodesulfobacteriota bacterium]|nr:radical SAM protein [Thermodesulfobacteriota bacterium]